MRETMRMLMELILIKILAKRKNW